MSAIVGMACSSSKNCFEIPYSIKNGTFASNKHISAEMHVGVIATI